MRFVNWLRRWRLHFGIVPWITVYMRASVVLVVSFWRWLLSKTLGPSCQHCGKRPATIPESGPVWCSEKCCNDDIPF
jgi:hypothetical protein